MQENESNKKLQWLEAFLIGIITLMLGLSVSFFPKMLTSIGFIVAAVVFFSVGLTDVIASVQYKNEAGVSKSSLWAGLISILAGAFMAVTIYMPSIKTEMVIIVLCVWAVLRCLFMLYGVITGKVKRKGAVISASVIGVAGILVFLFRDIIIASTRIIGYVLMAVGVLAIILGLYQRASERELKEKIEQEKREAKKLKKHNSQNEETKTEPEKENEPARIKAPEAEDEIRAEVSENEDAEEASPEDYTVEEMNE